MPFILLLIAAAVFLLVRRPRRDRAAMPEVGPVGWVDGTAWRAVAPLARVEVRQLLLHPAFVTAVVITFGIMALATNRDAGDEWVDLSGGIALGLAPFGWFTIVAAQLVTTRPSRTGADALFASLPAPQPVRTTALLATMLGAAAVATVLAGMTVAFLSTQERVMPGSPDVAEIGAGLLIAAGAVAVGVAIGRFLPHPLFGVAGIVAVILIQARFLSPTDWPWNQEEASPIRFLGFLGSPTSSAPSLEYRPAEWHLVYLAGLVGLMAMVALARNGVTRNVAIGLASALSVTALGGWMQTRPASASTIASMVRYLEHPENHQTCKEVASGRYCVFTHHRPTIKQWNARAQAVLALTPPTTRRLEVRERVATVVGNSNCTPIPFTASLIKGVAAAIDPARVWANDGVVHPGSDFLSCSSTSVNGLFFAVQVGAWRVGLPPSPHGRDERCYADGEARAALALWLGAAATPGGTKRLESLVNEELGERLVFQGWTDPPMWGVHFTVADARVALQMLRREKAGVAAALAPLWPRLTAAGTPTGEVAAALGLDSRPTPTAPQRTCA